MNHFIKALLLKYESEKATAIAELSVLIHYPAGIAEHTNIIQEMHNKVKAIAEAEDCISVVKEMQPSVPSDNSQSSN